MRDSLLPLFATTAVQVLVSMASVTVPVLAPAAAGELGISAGYVGLFVSLIYGGSMVATLGAGDLIHRHGAIRVSQFCLAFCAAGLLLAATGVVPLLALAALLIGFGYGPVTPASSHILSMNTPPHRMSFIFSIKQTGVPIGGALAGALVPVLVLWGGWRTAAAVVAAACVATMALAQPCRALFDGRRRSRHGAGVAGLSSSLRLTLGTPAIRRLAISSFFFAALQLCLVTYLVTYLTGSLGYTLVQAGLTLSVANGAGIAGRILWGALVGRGIDSLRMLALLACTMSVAAALTAAFSPAWPAAAVMLVAALFGATAIGWNGVYLAEVAKLAPDGRIAEVTGGGLFFTFFGVFVGPAAFALLVEHGVGYGEAFLLIAIPVLASGIRLLFVPPDPVPMPAPAHVTPSER